MNKLKVPYLQYEILEYFYLNLDISIGQYVDYPETSKILEEGIKKLREKSLLTSTNELSEFSKNLVREHVHTRYTFPIYNGLGLGEIKSTQMSLINLDTPKNGNQKIFRWYKYLEDFPHEFIKSSLKKYKLDKKYFVLDPFVGSGTTLIQTKFEGYKSVGLDINPAMVFISQNKLNWSLDIGLLKKILIELISKFKDLTELQKKNLFKLSNIVNMPKKELNQWLSPVKQWEVGSMLALIDKINTSSQIKNVLKFITSTAALNSSYVAFCPGTTFYPFRLKPNFLEEFVKIGGWILEDLSDPQVQENKSVISEVLELSSKEKDCVKRLKGKIDIIITSPPYPNDLEYTRQTRLELYLLGYVKNMQDVQELKRKMVKGSTKLIFKEDVILEEIKEMKAISKITIELKERLKDKNWGFDYPRMIQQYFSDMSICLENYYNVLVENGTCILVVGDQTFKGIVIPVAEILEEVAHRIGFRKTKIEFHRNRRSTTHEIPIPEENLILIK